MLSIVSADDHVLIREGVKKIIRSCKDMKLVGEAGTINEAIALIIRHQPDILILDINLPGHSGLEGLTEIRSRFPALPVLVLSMYPEERYAVRALKAGAAGYVTKSMAADELIAAIRKIAVGGSFISSSVAELLAKELRTKDTKKPQENLTNRELQIANLLAAGKQVKQIAAELGISISSVNTYRARIFKKTGVSSNTALVRYVMEKGLADPLST